MSGGANGGGPGGRPPEVLGTADARSTARGAPPAAPVKVKVPKRKRAQLLEMEDLNFTFDSAVLLPDYASRCDPTKPPQDRITGLAVLRACLVWQDGHAKQKLMIAGHTDTVGPPAYNQTLSKQRADNVLFALLGDKAQWASSCNAKHQVEDVQEILKWIAAHFGWDCDPGPVTRAQNPATTAATKKFQTKFNTDRGGSLTTNGAVDTATWAAFFDLYTEDLIAILGTDAAGLAALRGKLAFLSPSRRAVGFGERFPIDQPRRQEFRSPINRRVELLFFDPGEEPAADDDVYRPGRYRFRHLPCPGVLTTPGLAASLLADYDRAGGLDASEAEYKARLTRPGAIILANLDVSDATRLATPPARTDCATILDGVDALINGASDAGDLTAARVLERTPSAVRSGKVIMRIHAEDAKRIRVFDSATPAAVVLGKGKAAPPDTEHELPPGATSPWSFDFKIEAATFAGDHSAPGPTGPTPDGPSPFPVTLPSGSTGSPVFAARAPGEVWIELIHKDAAGTLLPRRDLGLFTIAPFIFIPNTLPCERIYTVYFAGGSGNHDFAFDMAEACKDAFSGGVTVPADTFTPLTPSTTASAEKLYLIDASRYPDQWAQDELQIGFSSAPQKRMHVVLHCKRARPLEDFVHEELVAPGFGLFDGIHGASADSLDYGGNLGICPPVATGTAAIARDDGGPSVKAHGPAPYGKIVIGDCTPRPLDKDYRQFLQAQRVQPVLPIDTSWLSVGHVDETISFIKASSGKPFRLLYASVRAMNVLLEEVKKAAFSDRSNFHCGKFEGGSYAEVSIEDLFTSSSGMSVRDFSNSVETNKLTPIQRRLEKGLALAPEDIVPVPTYWKIPTDPLAAWGKDENQTVAETVGMVNMQNVDNHLLIPKPFGPRMTVAAATTALDAARARLGITTPTVLGPTGHDFWAKPGRATLDRLGKFFARPATLAERQTIIDHINGGPALPAALQTLCDAKRQEIVDDPKNAPLKASPSPVVDAAGNFTSHFRVFVPEPTVDILEAYMRTALEPLGAKLHFIDDWYKYHIQMGEVHCGSNAKRRMPEDEGLDPWWNMAGAYRPDADETWDPAA